MIKRVLVGFFLLVAALGAAQAQSYQYGQISESYMTHGYMAYQYALINYPGTSGKAPLLIFEHENSEGDTCYSAGGGSGNCNYVPGNEMPWLTSAWIARYCPTTTGCVVLIPYADQTSDPSGSTSNFGGYGDSPCTMNNELAVVAITQQFQSTYNLDPGRIYVTGGSLGGIGTDALLADYGVGTGTCGKIFTGGLALSGALNRGAPTNAQIAQIEGGPFNFAVTGAGDTQSSNPANWTNPVWTAITGNTNYPGPPTGAVAGSSPFRYLLDTNLGHDTWDTYYSLTASGQPIWDLLFAVTTGGGGGGGGATLTGTPDSTLPSGYLNVSGNQVVDGSGNNVRLACEGYNWPDGTGTETIPLIRAQGFACIRVPWYDAVFCPGGTCDFTTNDKNGLGYASPDQVVSAAAASNMKVIWEHQGNEGDVNCGAQQNGLWYDLNSSTPVAGIVWNSSNNTDGNAVGGTVTYQTFRNNSVAWAQHYAGNATVIGFDLDNENANDCWGCGSGADMLAMAKDTGSAMETADPGALIIVECPINSTGVFFNGQTMPISSQNDCTLAASKPVVLTGDTSNHVVYSVHDFPTDVTNLTPDSGPTKVAAMNTAWGSLETSNTAPVWIGQAGASLDGTTCCQSDEAAWAQTLVSYINGQQGSLGGPTFTGCAQPIGADWWQAGYFPGQVIDGSLLSNNQSNPGQQTYWSQMLYTTCSVQLGGGGGGGATTWNPNDLSGVTLSNGNLTATSTAGGAQGVRSTTSQSSPAKVCFEVIATAITGNWDVGLSNASFNLATTLLGGDSNGVGFDPNSAGGTQGIFFNNATLSSGASASVSGEAATICEDLGANEVWATTQKMRANGTPWNNSTTANPATGVGGIPISGLTCPCLITFNEDDANGVATLNAGGPFAVPLPSGFSAWGAASVTTGPGRPFFFIFGQNDLPILDEPFTLH